MLEKEIEKLAQEYADENKIVCGTDKYGYITTDCVGLKEAFMTGFKVGRPKWNKFFESALPYYDKHWGLSQDGLPKIDNFYFVKLKGGFVKICKLNNLSGKMCFYDLYGEKQSNVVEWLDYPVVQGD